MAALPTVGEAALTSRPSVSQVVISPSLAIGTKAGHSYRRPAPANRSVGSDRPGGSPTNLISKALSFQAGREPFWAEGEKKRKSITRYAIIAQVASYSTPSPWVRAGGCDWADGQRSGLDGEQPPVAGGHWQQGQLARIIGPWTGIPRAAQAWSTEPRTRAAGGYGPSQIEVRPRADALLPLLGQCSRRPA